MDYSACFQPCANVCFLSVYVALLSLKFELTRWLGSKIMMAHISAYSFSPSFKSVLTIWRL